MFLAQNIHLCQESKNRYLKNILVKIGADLSLHQSKKLILKVIDSVHKMPQFRSVRFTIDVDPQ